MKLTSKQINFRNERAHDLSVLADLVEKVEIESYPIREAAKELKNFERTKKINQNDDVDYSFWGYKIDSLEIPFTATPRHIRPNNIYPLSAFLSIELIASSKCWGDLCDPFRKLEFNIEIKGKDDDGKDHIICYHIDKHMEGESDEPHPAYHFHFGGKRMNFDEIESGNVIFLDTPRLVFYPVDIILGMDFVLSNFFTDRWQKLLQTGEYPSLIGDYYNHLVRPFAHSLASGWTPFDQQDIKWDPQLILPQLKY